LRGVADDLDGIYEALKENAELNFRVNETRSRVAALVERLPKAEEPEQAEGEAE